MQMLKDLKAKAQAAVDRQHALLAKIEAEKRELTAEEQTAFDADGVVVAKALADIKRLQDVEVQRAAIASVVDTIAETVVARDVTGVVERIAQPVRQDTLPAQVKTEHDGFVIAGACAWAAARAKAYPSVPILKHLEDFGCQKIADLCRANEASLRAVDKSLTSLGGGGGDNVIFTPLAQDFINFLYNQSAFLSGQPMTFDMPNGSLKIPGGNASATGAYATEVADIGYSQMTTRQVSMSAKHLKVITAISNYLIEISPLAVASIVGQDLAMSMVTSMDAAGLRGSGSGANPSGILVLTNAAHLVNSVPGAAPKAPTVAEVEVDAKAQLTALRASNIPFIRPRYTVSNRVFTYLQFLRNSLALPVYPGLQGDKPTWLDGIPIVRSEQVPNNLSDGTNSDCSELYLTLFGHIMMGIARTLRLEASREASYVNSGTLSAFSRDETVIRGIASHDFGMRYDKSNYTVKQVRWGA